MSIETSRGPIHRSATDQSALRGLTNQQLMSGTVVRNDRHAFDLPTARPARLHGEGPDCADGS
jgi:hypothetical protein